MEISNLLFSNNINTAEPLEGSGNFVQQSQKEIPENDENSFLQALFGSTESSAEKSLLDFSENDINDLTSGQAADSKELAKALFDKSVFEKASVENVLHLQNAQNLTANTFENKNSSPFQQEIAPSYSPKNTFVDPSQKPSGQQGQIVPTQLPKALEKDFELPKQAKEILPNGSPLQLNGEIAQIQPGLEKTSETLKKLKSILPSSQEIINQSMPLSLLTGSMPSIEDPEIMREILSNPLIQEALSSKSEDFLSKEFAVGELIALSDFPRETLEKISNLHVNLDEKITVSQFLKTVGIDPHKVAANLNQLKEMLPETKIEKASLLGSKSEEKQTKNVAPKISKKQEPNKLFNKDNPQLADAKNLPTAPPSPAKALENTGVLENAKASLKEVPKNIKGSNSPQGFSKESLDPLKEYFSYSETFAEEIPKNLENKNSITKENFLISKESFTPIQKEEINLSSIDIKIPITKDNRILTQQNLKDSNEISLSLLKAPELAALETNLSNDTTSNSVILKSEESPKNISLEDILSMETNLGKRITVREEKTSSEDKGFLETGDKSDRLLVDREDFSSNQNHNQNQNQDQTSKQRDLNPAISNPRTRPLEISQNTLEATHTLRKTKADNAKITLDDDILGKIKLNVNLHDDKISLDITSNQETLTKLEDSSNHLKEALREQKLELSNLDFRQDSKENHQQREQGTSNFFAFDKQHQGNKPWEERQENNFYNNVISKNNKDSYSANVLSNNHRLTVLPTLQEGRSIQIRV